MRVVSDHVITKDMKNDAKKEIQSFEVSMKGFLINEEGELLLVQDASSKRWELPGGRIDVGEEFLPQEEVLRRELVEELGSEAEIAIGPPIATWTKKKKSGTLIFLVGWLCDYEGGAIVLSGEHMAMRWVDEEGSYELELEEGYAVPINEFWDMQYGEDDDCCGTEEGKCAECSCG